VCRFFQHCGILQNLLSYRCTTATRSAARDGLSSVGFLHRLCRDSVRRFNFSLTTGYVVLMVDHGIITTFHACLNNLRNPGVKSGSPSKVPE